MRARFVVMGVVVWGALGSARAETSGLAGLDADLNATGRVGTFSPRSEAPIVVPSIPDPEAIRQAPDTAAGRLRRQSDARVDETAGLSDQEYEQTDSAVAECRIEVARRRRVSATKVSAGTVVLRFTVEQSGHVRDAEAVSATDTDLEVAACAKRVLSEWVFARHASGEVTVERAYRLGDGRAAIRADRLAPAAH
ncbi:MAG TPA: AgmX/PglI C-terminal domain-containing protein [Polyangia bacterium]|nr:AgmX/PglI C-terminal domain-containing protein [Polyangia bacterium]